MEPIVSPQIIIDPLTPYVEKLAGSAHDEERIRGAAQAFEGFFVSYMLKTMRETVHPGLVKNEAGEMFYSFYDQEIGRLAAQRGAFGLGDMVETYIRQQRAGTDQTQLKISFPAADNGNGDGGTPESPKPSSVHRYRERR
jgi:flagellar protein FlgJ